MFINILLSMDHILYIVFSPIVVGIIVYLGTLIKTQKWKDIYLGFWALACFFFHISCCYTTLFSEVGQGNKGVIVNNQLIPIYFCNFIMYLQLVVAFWFDKKTKLFQNFATFTAWGGIFGALITLFVTPPGFPSWPQMQSAFSHSCLLITSTYLFAAKYVRINVFNLIPYTFGLLATGIVGGLVELLYWSLGFKSPNAMYLVHGPVEAPSMHGGYFALAMLAIIFVIAAIYEFIFKKDKNTRWYKSIKDIELYLPLKVKEKEEIIAE